MCDQDNNSEFNPAGSLRNAPISYDALKQSGISVGGSKSCKGFLEFGHTNFLKGEFVGLNEA